MRDDIKQSGSDERSAVAGSDELPSASRRAMLLKGLGKGTAVLAVTAPVKTFAVIPSVTADGRLCSMSGFNSGGQSLRPVTAQCVGHSPGYWKNHDNWPSDYNSSLEPGTGTSFIATFGAFKTIPLSAFWSDGDKGNGGGKKQGGGGATTDPTLRQVLQYENSDEFHWIGALLNAAAGAQGFYGANYVYPYTASEVIDFYNGISASGHSYAEALAFFKALEGTI